MKLLQILKGFGSYVQKIYFKANITAVSEIYMTEGILLWLIGSIALANPLNIKLMYLVMVVLCLYHLIRTAFRVYGDTYPNDTIYRIIVYISIVATTPIFIATFLHIASGLPMWLSILYEISLALQATAFFTVKLK